MSGLEWKMANRFERMAVSNGWLYGILRKHALCHSAVLPQSADSLEILQAVSRRPQGGLNVELRSWPERPKYDISIIVPCHNVERFVEDCVQSIITQRTSRSFEVICVDDGSTDATGHILDHFASQANAVRVIHQNNFGEWLRTSGITAGIPVAAPLHHMDERLMHPEDRGTRWRRVMQAD